MGKILKIFLIIFIIFILLIAGAVFYLYQFHVFKTLRICISKDIQDTGISCNENKDCYNLFLENIGDFEMENVPDFMKEKFSEILDNAIICESTCRVKEIYGLDEELDSCNSGDQEIVQEIRGKEGIKILLFLKERK
jgi:hypothetical protein